MKSLPALALALLFAASLASCNKEYTCRCKDHQGAQQDYNFKATSRKMAKNDCESYNYKNGTIAGSCDLIH